MFMNDVVKAARQDMVEAGYDQLTTPEEVDEAFSKQGSTLVLVNSVCGCAGGIARPSAAYMKNYEVQADQFVTVFAGQDKEATEKARGYFTGFAPSSPSFALLKDGEIKMMLERHQIEGHEPIEVVKRLEEGFDTHFK